MNTSQRVFSKAFAWARIFSNAAKCAARARREPDSEPCQNKQCLGIASPEIPGKAFPKEVNYSSVMISQAILSFPSNPVILRLNLCFVPTCSHHFPPYHSLYLIPCYHHHHHHLHHYLWDFWWACGCPWASAWLLRKPATRGYKL